PALLTSIGIILTVWGIVWHFSPSAESSKAATSADRAGLDVATARLSYDGKIISVFTQSKGISASKIEASGAWGGFTLQFVFFGHPGPFDVSLGIKSTLSNVVSDSINIWEPVMIQITENVDNFVEFKIPLISLSMNPTPAGQSRDLRVIFRKR